MREYRARQSVYWGKVEEQLNEFSKDGWVPVNFERHTSGGITYYDIFYAREEPMAREVLAQMMESETSG